VSSGELESDSSRLGALQISVVWIRWILLWYTADAARGAETLGKSLVLRLWDNGKGA